MSTAIPNDQEIRELKKEWDAARKAGEEIWEQRNERFNKLRETTGEVEREILKEELMKLNALCASASKKCHTLQSLHTWWLYQLGIDDYYYYYYCNYNVVDERDGPVTGDCS